MLGLAAANNDNVQKSESGRSALAYFEIDKGTGSFTGFS